MSIDVLILSITVTDREFEVIDELYFVTSFKDLLSVLKWKENELVSVLVEVIKKDWVKCIDHSTEEELEDALSDFERLHQKVLCLATKKGLLEHNSR